MARKQGHNKALFEQKIKNEINIALRRTIADPRLTMVSVTRVELTADYSHAKVYWDTYDSSKRGDIKKALDGISSKLRSILAKELDVRHTPHLELFYDSQIEDELNIENLLAKSSSDDD
jgi:ribosome-binding factor A